MNTLRSRLARIMRLRKAAKPVYSTSALPALTYGCSVYGVDDKEDHELRQASARVAGGGRGKRLNVYTVFYDDQSWRATCGPILAWATAIWNFNTPMAQATVGPAELREAWQRVADEQPTKWGNVRGPASAAWLSMRRVGWIWESPFH